MAGTTVFHEHWYRIRDLKVSLSSVVDISRQRYRGEVWYVLSSNLHNKYYRLNSHAYKVIALLDGRRSIDQAWHEVARREPEHTPSQGEVIQILAQLFSAGMLRGEVLPDTGAILRSIDSTQWQGRKAFIGSIFFPRIPLFDPDKILEGLLPLFSPLFSWFGVLLWFVLIIYAGAGLAGFSAELRMQTSLVLTPSNLPWLYLCIVITKLVHECGHGLLCKILGNREGENTEVHTFGIMLLVFSPLPYIDVSSAWKLRNKWHRALVGMGGMLFELVVAALAALVWVRVEPNSPVHKIAYNIMFVSGVSTLIFNSNPLLRYDGYYVMCDLLGIPNLANRANIILKSFLKTALFGTDAVNEYPFNVFERILLPVYAVSALIYRIVVFVGISMFIAEQLLLVGVLVGVSGAVGIVIKPVFSFIRYVLYNHELRGCRKRALSVTVSLILMLFIAFGVIPFTDYDRVEGVVEAEASVSVRAGVNGEILDYAEGKCLQIGEVLVITDNPELRSRLERIEAEYNVSELQLRQALVEGPVASQIASEQQEMLLSRIENINKDIQKLKVDAKINGVWTPDENILIKGAYVKKGQLLGKIHDCERLRVRCVAKQDTAAAIINEGDRTVEIRIKQSPGVCLKARVVAIAPAGRKDISSMALSDVAGGELETVVNKMNQRISQERLFDILLELEQDNNLKELFSGQVVVARVKISDKPLLIQLWDGVLQILQRKYQI